MARAVGIAGLGLMGGSLALALRRCGQPVTGYDPAAATRAAAASQGLRVTTTAAELADCDAVFVAAPLSRLPEAFAALSGCRGIVSDLGSVKAPVVDWGEAAFGSRFVGGHPMAGTEKVGFGGADPDLFQGAVWVLTPTPRTDPAATALVRELLSPLGVRLVTMAAADHDATVAAISHLPYLTACALAETARRQPEQDAVRLLAASGFRDTTRLAMANPELGRDLCLGNQEALIRLIPQLQAILADWQDRIAAADRPGLDAAFGSIAAWRQQFDPARQP